MAERANDTAAKMLAKATEKVEALTSENAALKDQNVSLQTAVNLSQKLDKDHQALIATLQKENAQLKSLVQSKQPALPAAILHDEPVAFEGKQYMLLLPKIHIPGIGLRTALEIAVEEEQTAMAALVKSESGAIKEVQ